MNVFSLSRRLTGIDGEDTWTGYQFDSAVVMYGSWIEGKLSERDDQGTLKWTLAELLDAKPEHIKRARKAMMAMQSIFGPVENWDAT